ncbi:hypothetical protein TRFO_25675 [Tritrichomonas foetus]|uniref:Uncharacterized protein n=1 Tax=Tritrichomonas foetus TaxID=1144522 RepID=A0A1J4K4F9_9EUKA|nr:hypothetical protein TRFO_25675 [Tritrichomonas foetus]|eukprot:OHT06271.1 hypothetical protein TRFO_25675 [Tritrichomonas foetus]
MINHQNLNNQQQKKDEVKTENMKSPTSNNDDSESILNSTPGMSYDECSWDDYCNEIESDDGDIFSCFDFDWNAA